MFQKGQASFSVPFYKYTYTYRFYVLPPLNLSSLKSNGLSENILEVLGKVYIIGKYNFSPNFRLLLAYESYYLHFL